MSLFKQLKSHVVPNLGETLVSVNNDMFIGEFVTTESLLVIYICKYSMNWKPNNSSIFLFLCYWILWLRCLEKNSKCGNSSQLLLKIETCGSRDPVLLFSKNFKASNRNIITAFVDIIMFQALYNIEKMII